MKKRIEYILLLLVCAFAAVSCDSAVENKSEPDVVFVTTPHNVVREMLKLAGVAKDDVVYDLGSGDGRIVISAARDFGARGVGVDIDPRLVAEGKENARKAGVSERVTFIEQDVLKADISQATVIALYMLPTMNKQLLPKFFTELQPGTRVVSHRFEIGDWKPDMTLKAYDTTIYLSIIPADVHGEWRIAISNDKETRHYGLTLRQRHQELEGSLKDDNRKFSVAATRLHGREITISVADTIGGQRFLMDLGGLVNGETLQGTALVTDARHPLPATYTWKGVRMSP
jgi:cyclopropane fatty-acyl-phospholipid synthase-like methyltransferase